MLYFSGLVIHGFLLSLSLAAYIMHPYGTSLAYVPTITVGHRQADESAGTLVSRGAGLMRPAVTPWCDLAWSLRRGRQARMRR